MPLRLALAQLDLAVGDIEGNAQRVLEHWNRGAEAACDLVVFTELAVTGYPPEDLLFKPEFVAANAAALESLAAAGPPGTAAVVGFVGSGRDGDGAAGRGWDVTVTTSALRNSAAVLADGRVQATYDKRRLPNYGVFDEARYFVPGQEPLVVTVAGVPVAVTVCEDLWADEPIADAAARGARVLVNINASPFHRGKRDEREHWVRRHATRHGMHVAYVNQVGGQDGLVFDGDSVVYGPDATVVARAPQFAEDHLVVDLDPGGAQGAQTAVELAGAAPADRPPLPRRPQPPVLDPVAEVWQALVLGTRDYCRKNGFARAVVGVSGGIDSAVTLAVAADALDPADVLAVAMPSPYSSDASLEDARVLAHNLGVDLTVVPIDAAMSAFRDMLADDFAGTDEDVTEENIQARIRGVLLMAFSNKFGRILLSTGNKSELAVGYATLYGDMAGGFAVLKDCTKGLVYDLADHRNARGAVIPVRTIERPPSAELRPDQRDSDTLPPYETLDPIVRAYVESNRSIADIVAAGHDEETVRQVVAMIDRAEYKRRQAPPGVRITPRAFGRDRRVPITNAWRPGG